ncbi:hypothetical protein KR018_008338 [Drosophila ironensis]|nr:hypothetical protein KR018_008338 [Drosophila ironensis]
MTTKQETLKDVTTVRILIMGDKGVGKSALADLMATTPITPTPASRTVGDGGWRVQVRLYEYPLQNGNGLPRTCAELSGSSAANVASTSTRAASPENKEVIYFVEFFDMDSDMPLDRDQCEHFFRQMDGLVLVYDTQNVNSQDNLHDWLYEPLRQICRHRHHRAHPILKRHHVPIFVVGTHLDKQSSEAISQTGSIAHQLGAEEILVNCRDASTFAESTINRTKLYQFFDSVVEFKERFPLQNPRSYL